MRFLVLNPSPANLDKVIAKANIQNQKNGPFDSILFLGDAAGTVPTANLDTPGYICLGRDVEAPETPATPETNYNVITEATKTIKVEDTTILFVSAGAETPEAVAAASWPKADILITYDWPHAIARQENLVSFGSKAVDDIVKATRPTYHFAVGPNHKGKFFENLPYKWSEGGHTRFISLGQEGTGDKWYYAFKFEPENPAQMIANPFEESKKRRAEPMEMEAKRRQVEPKVVTQAECFFCLSNPNIETHMIVAIGTKSYLTVAKGPLTRALQKQPFLGHLIITPIDHIPTTADQPETAAEMAQFESAIVKSFAKTDLIPIFFEISRKANVHHHIQMVPIPNRWLEKFESVLNLKAQQNNEKYADKNQRLEFERTTEPPTVKGDFMKFTVHAPAGPIYFTSPLSESDKQADLQFPRRVLAVTINQSKRIYWNQCTQPKFVETEECDAFKKFFRPHDFTVG